MEQVVINGFYLGAQYALIALGLTLIFALMNVLNFAHGQMYVLGGFVVYQLYGQAGMPFVFALIVSGITLAVVGAIIERYLFRTVIKRSVREESTMLLAAGIAFFLDAVILLAFGEKQRGVPKLVDGVFNWDFRIIMPYDRILVGILALSAIVGFVAYMQYSKPGRAMRALAQDRVAAQLMGVNVDFYSMVGFSTGALLAARRRIGHVINTDNPPRDGIGPVRQSDIRPLRHLEPIGAITRHKRLNDNIVGIDKFDQNIPPANPQVVGGRRRGHQTRARTAHGQL